MTICFETWKHEATLHLCSLFPHTVSWRGQMDRWTVHLPIRRQLRVQECAFKEKHMAWCRAASTSLEIPVLLMAWPSKAQLVKNSGISISLSSKGPIQIQLIPTPFVTSSIAQVVNVYALKFWWALRTPEWFLSSSWSPWSQIVGHLLHSIMIVLLLLISLLILVLINKETEDSAP